MSHAIYLKKANSCVCLHDFGDCVKPVWFSGSPPSGKGIPTQLNHSRELCGHRMRNRIAHRLRLESDILLLAGSIVNGNSSLIVIFLLFFFNSFVFFCCRCCCCCERVRCAVLCSKRFRINWLPLQTPSQHTRVTGQAVVFLPDPFV